MLLAVLPSVLIFPACYPRAEKSSHSIWKHARSDIEPEGDSVSILFIRAVVSHRRAFICPECNGHDFSRFKLDKIKL